MQESAPEHEDLKIEIFAEMDAHARPDVILSSSSSAFLPSHLQSRCTHPGRVVIGHPFAPSYLLPLVEVVGGDRTDPEALAWTCAFYDGLGKRAVLLKKEVEGYISNRFQMVVSEEATRLVEAGICDWEAVDLAVTEGPGLRWPFLGPLTTNHLAGGQGGLAHSIEMWGWGGSDESREFGACLGRRALRPRLDGRSGGLARRPARGPAEAASVRPAQAVTEASLRQGWRRGTPALAVDEAAVAGLVTELFDDARLEAITPLSGGLANTNLKLELGDGRDALVLRLYQRDARAALREAALARLVAGRVPAPTLHHVEPEPDRLGAPFALYGFVAGVPLDTALASATGAEETAQLGAALGAALAAVHGIGFDRPGFLGDDLAVATPLEEGAAGIVGFVRHQLARETVAGRLGAERGASLLAFVEDHAPRLDGGTTGLVHADANGSNVLVRREAGAWQIAALLDWEFAFAGSGLMDLGNATRPPAGDDEAWLAGMEAGYRQAGGVLEEDWPALARLVDLTAWLDFAGRPDATAELLADCRRMIDRTLALA